MRRSESSRLRRHLALTSRNLSRRKLTPEQIAHQQEVLKKQRGKERTERWIDRGALSVGILGTIVGVLISADGKPEWGIAMSVTGFVMSSVALIREASRLPIRNKPSSYRRGLSYPSSANISRSSSQMPNYYETPELPTASDVFAFFDQPSSDNQE
jgi:hypothetical protein